jgi:hypothetical protein
MRRLILVAAVLCLLGAPAAVAGTPLVANGGGRGTVDGVTPFSQFGFNVTVGTDGAVRGHFNCLMAGASEFPGFDLMAVRGRVETATITGTTASLVGSGMFQTGNQGKSPAMFVATVTEGGPGVGTLQLTLLTPFLFVLPVERVLNGTITVH